MTEKLALSWGATLRAFSLAGSVISYSVVVAGSLILIEYGIQPDVLSAFIGGAMICTACVISIRKLGPLDAEPS